MKKGLVIRNKDVNERLKSTSGGVFATIAKEVIFRGGVVYGVSLTENLRAKHIKISSIEELDSIRGSKYIQSDPGNTFKMVKKDLLTGKLVCYSGTPCQIYGLSNYLQDNYDNLLLIEVACFSVASWKSLDFFLKYKKLDVDKINRINFRDKTRFGYLNSQFTVYGKKDEIIHSSGAESNQFLRAFTNNYSTRPSCYNCQFKRDYRAADFTIWDNFFPRKSFCKDDTGCSNMLINTLKGYDFFKSIIDDFDYYEINYNELLSSEDSLNYACKKNSKRDQFMYMLSVGENPYEIYLRNTLKIKVLTFLRWLLVKLKLYSFFKRKFSNLKNKKKYKNENY